MSVTFAHIKELRETRKRLADRAGAILTTAHQAHRQLSPTELDSWEKMMGEVDAMTPQIEAKATEYQRDMMGFLKSVAPDIRTAGREDMSWGAGAAGDPEKPWAVPTNGKLTNQQRSALRKYLAYGTQGVAQFDLNEMRSFFKSDARTTPGGEVRALSAITGSAGADTIPQGFVFTLDIATKFYGGIIEAAAYIDTEMGNLMPYPSMNDTTNTGEQTAENQPVSGATGGSAEVDPTFGVINLAAYMFDSGIILLPIQLVQDSAFDVEDFLDDALQTRIGRKLNNACTVGNGSTYPLGVVNAASIGKQGASPTSIAYTELVDLEHSLDLSYRRKGNAPRASWMFHDLTMAYIRKLTDNNGRPLFIAGGTAEGIINAAPDMLMGYPYWINNDMAQLGSTNKSVLFGDFKKYKIRRVRQMQLVRFGERFMDKLQYGYLCFQRYDGQLVDAGTHPVVYFQNSAT